MNPGEFDFAARARAERRLAILTAESPDCVTVARARTSVGRSTESSKRCVNMASNRSARTSARARPESPRPCCWACARSCPVRKSCRSFLTGTVHLLVVSGLNVAILATGLYALTWIGWLPRRVALALIIAVVVAYTLVAGGEPPVLRAAVLVVLVCVGAWTGRRGAAFNSLAAAAVIVLAINPARTVSNRNAAELSLRGDLDLGRPVVVDSLATRSRSARSIDRRIAAVARERFAIGRGVDCCSCC